MELRHDARLLNFERAATPSVLTEETTEWLVSAGQEHRIVGIWATPCGRAAPGKRSPKSALS